MSDRKYRQRGYQDEPRQPKAPSVPKPQEPRGPRDPTEFRVTKTVGFTNTIRCTRCGNTVGEEVAYDSKCKRCGVDLRSCVQCESFDPGAVFECRRKILARVTPQDARNTCSLFAARIQVERETGSTPASRGSSGARKAFDDLFKF
jgi:hypothetical protein